MPSLLRCANFLSPLLLPTYAAITRALGEASGLTATLDGGTALTDFAAGRVDVGFLCGVQYTQLRAQAPKTLELLAAPVLTGKRYQGQPRYYSDVVVRADRPWQTWHDLFGRTWGFNEPASYSGYTVVAARLREQQRSWRFFGKLVETGSHLRSLDLVLAGEIDAAPIDSHVYDAWRYQRRRVATRLRSISMLGPSPIPPLVVGTHVAPALRERLRAALVHLHEDASVAPQLRRGRIARFVAVDDATYDPIRAMQAACHVAEDADLRCHVSQ